MASHHIYLLNLEVIFPCSKSLYTHPAWLIGILRNHVMFKGSIIIPIEKLIAMLNSMPGDFVKPNAEASLKKMWMLLQMVHSSLDEHEWQFVANKPGDLPQEGYNDSV